MDPFKFHTGFDYNMVLANNQLRGDCIFCGEEKHFFIDPKDWGWDCKKCMKKGYIYNFIQEFYNLLIEDPVQILSWERGIELEYFRRNGVRYNQFRSSESYHVFVIPTYNSQGAINNLYKIVPHPEKPGKRLIMGTPSLEATLFNFPATSHDTIWMTEGKWDKIAGDQVTEGRDVTCIGWPGSAFKPQWTKPLGNKHVVFLPDNDPAGEAELQRAIKHINKASIRPKSIKRIKWPEGTPKGYDLNDALKTHGCATFDFIQRNLVDYIPPEQLISQNAIYADPSCDSFDKLLETFSDNYHFTNDLRLLILALCSAFYAIKIGGEQIWWRIMAPPGAFKTKASMILGASEIAVIQDTFTGLLSGWKDEQETDASLVPMIAEKALIIKDADALLQEPNCAKILSELRAFYDKYIAVTYKNRISYKYNNIPCSFIFNGTHTLRGMDNSSLGERFLDFELHMLQEDRHAIAERVYHNAIRQATTDEQMDEVVKEKAKGFLDNHLLLRKGVVLPTDKEKEAILKCGNLISYLRANVERDYKGKLKYHPSPEVPSRIVGQLTKLFMCAPTVMGASSVPRMVHELVRHATKDIININSPRYRIANFMHAFPYQDGDEICRYMHPMNPMSVAIEMEDMKELGMLHIDKKRSSTCTLVPTFGLRPDIHEDFTYIATEVT